MDAQAIIRLIQTADKKTPVKVYLNVTEPIKFEKCKVFGQGNSQIIFGDYQEIAPILAKESAKIIEIEIEETARNSAIPLLDLKEIDARIEPGAIIRDQVTIGDHAVIMMGAIINIGAEDEKGNELVKSTIPLLRECKDINFIGSVESRDIPNGPADVLVCEAFVGNVLLKFFEGLGKMFMAEIKDTLKSSVKTKIGGALIYKPIKKTFKRYMADDKGGAPLLGLKGLVVKIHGNSKDTEVRSAIEQCRNFVKKDVTNQIIRTFVEEENKGEN